MFSKKRTFAAVALATGAALALAGCAGDGGEADPTFDPEEEVTLDLAFWGNDVRAELYNEAIAAFNQMSSHLQALEREALALKEREHLGEMGEVARGMAHALRNPLHAVGLSVDELASRLPDDPDAAAMAAAARRQIAGVDGTIRSFLALAAGGGAEEEVDVRALAEEVALAALQEARGRVRVSVAPGGAARLLAVAPELTALRLMWA